VKTQRCASEVQLFSHCHEVAEMTELDIRIHI
jgi:hypothetical protein